MSTPAERVAAAKARATELRLEHEADVEAARASIPTVQRDGDTTDAETETLTRREIERRIQARVEQAEQRYAEQLDALTASIGDDADRLQRDAAGARPQLDGDAVTWQRAAMAWDGVKARLEHEPWSVILQDADQTTALAIAEWAPAYLQAEAARTRPSGLAGTLHSGPDLDAVARAVDARLADIDPTFGAARAAAVEAAGVSAFLAQTGSGDAPESGLSGLEAAVAAHYAEQAVHVEHGTTAADPVPVDAGAPDAGGDGAAA